VWAGRLDTELGLAPMSSLGVVPVVLLLVHAIPLRAHRFQGVRKRAFRGVVPDGVVGL
jgi:hypothetical protein